MPKVTISNTSSHDQIFEVHGANNNANVTVKAHGNGSFTTPDHKQASLAVIALHEGHEGEQAEITFNGYGNNTFYDISVIVGAGGNLTIQQVGKPGTIKGDHEFMQQLREAWKKANQNTKDVIKQFITLDNHGEVIRMGAPKSSKALEDFVRTFANWKVYIGVGAWDGNKGNPADNFQSKGTPGGNDDVSIVYSDWTTPLSPHTVAHMVVHEAVLGPTATSRVDAGHQPVEPETAVAAALQDTNSKPAEAGPAAVEVAEAAPAPVTNGAPTNGAATNGDTAHPHIELKEAIAQKSLVPQNVGDADHGQPGIILSNKSPQQCTYYFFNNYWNGNGTGGANFDKPERAITLRGHTTAFVGLNANFKGRVQRGKYIPATWAEFQLEASNDHAAHGDISLEQGYDGPATIRSLDNSNRSNGFTNDIMTGAPAAAIVTRKEDGRKVLASTMGNWLGGPNQAAIKWEQEKVGQKKAYITGGEGTDDVASKNRRMGVDFY